MAKSRVVTPHQEHGAMVAGSETRPLTRQYCKVFLVLSASPYREEGSPREHRLWTILSRDVRGQGGIQVVDYLLSESW